MVICRTINLLVWVTAGDVFEDREAFIRVE
jgi:hypothetical protein